MIRVPLLSVVIMLRVACACTASDWAWQLMPAAPRVSSHLQFSHVAASDWVVSMSNQQTRICKDICNRRGMQDMLHCYKISDGTSHAPRGWRKGALNRVAATRACDRQHASFSIPGRPSSIKLVDLARIPQVCHG